MSLFADDKRLVLVDLEHRYGVAQGLSLFSHRVRGRRSLLDQRRVLLGHLVHLADCCFGARRHWPWSLRRILGTLATRSIVRPLERVVEGSNALAQGDLSGKVEVFRHDEVGAVAESLNHAMTQLATIVKGVKHIARALVYALAPSFTAAFISLCSNVSKSASASRSAL
jgi:HAMP domain-containing protein